MAVVHVGQPDERGGLRSLRTDLLSHSTTNTAKYAAIAFRQGVRAALAGQAWVDVQAAAAQAANDRDALTAAGRRASDVFGAIQDASTPDEMASAIGGLLALLAPSGEGEQA